MEVGMDTEHINTPLYLHITDTDIKQKGVEWVQNMLRSDMTYTKAGSLSFLLHGRRPSEQSISIKMGRFGEFITKEMIKCKSNLELLTCGIQQINNKKKDVDLIFKDEINKIIYYRELKGNIELDTEKIPATVAKCNEIKTSLQLRYTDYLIDCAVLNWSVYNRNILTSGISNIKTFEISGVKIEHMEDFIRIVNIEWQEEEFYEYFREIGILISSSFTK
jgi:hypothetical protein